MALSINRLIDCFIAFIRVITFISFLYWRYFWFSNTVHKIYKVTKYIRVQFILWVTVWAFICIYVNLNFRAYISFSSTSIFIVIFSFHRWGLHHTLPRKLDKMPNRFRTTSAEYKSNMRWRDTICDRRNHRNARNVICRYLK